MAEGDTQESGLQNGEAVPWEQEMVEVPTDERGYSPGEAAAIADTHNQQPHHEQPRHVHVLDEEVVQPQLEVPPQPEVEPLACQAAFLVFLDGGGHWIADSSKLNVPVIVTRQCTPNDFRHAVADMDQDITATATAGRMLMAQQEMMQKAMQQQEAQRIAQSAGLIPKGGVDLAELSRRMTK